MPRKVPVSLPPKGAKRCCFCGLYDDNEFEYGKFHEYDGIITHYYCLLFSSNMQQKGLDDEGILGFLPVDIHKELKRGRRLPCCYCKKSGATLGCCNTKCKKIFHFPCGLKAGSLHQYFGEFRSYCLHHRPKQIIDERVLQEISHCETRVCYICYDEVNPRDFLATIWAPCCKKNAWFHRTCVQQLAMSAGYFFKCPLCNNKAEFQRAMLDHGIFIPSQDASWELVPNAFQELLYRHNRCDAENCMCPKGREYTSTNAKWELTLCRTCGSQGIHMACGNLKWAEPMWECNECTSILNKSMITDSSVSRLVIETTREITEEKNLLIDEDSTSDSDISVGDYPEIPMETTVPTSLISQSPSYVHQEQKDEQSQYQTRTKTPLRSVENGIAQTRPEFRRSRNEEFPPLTKKPKIVSSMIEDKNDRRNSDSDDDVIVVSGPSRKETSQPINETRWNHVDSRSKILEKTIENHPGNKKSRQNSRVIENSSMVSSTNFTGKSTIGNPSRFERVPIEIDLSDSESVSTTSASIISDRVSSSTINPDFTSNSALSIPELNIQITNVTSLAPEVFANAPDTPEQSLKDSTTNHQANNDLRVDLSRQSSNQYRSIQTRVFESPMPEPIPEGLQIVRLEGTTDSSSPIKPIYYGIAIPGTNTVLPFVVSTESSPQNLTSPRNDSTKLQNDSSSLIAKLSKLAGPKSRKEAILAAAMKQSMIRSNEEPIVVSLQSTIPTRNETLNVNSTTISSNEKPKPNPSRLSYSVPLETVVNDRILQSKSDKCSRTNDGFGSRSRSVLKTNESARTNESRVTSVNQTISSSRPEITAPMVSKVPNGAIYTSRTQIQSELLTSRTSINLPNTPLRTQESSLPSNFTLNGIRNTVIKSTRQSEDSSWNVTLSSDNPNDRTNKIAQSSANVNNQMEPCKTRSDQTHDDSPKNCDGDAGSSPAVQSAPDDKFDRSRATVEVCRTVAAENDRDRWTVEESNGDRNGLRNDAKFTAQKNDEIERSTTIDRGDSPHRTGLINKTIHIRDLKFTVCGSNIVKMTLYNTYRVNINVERGSVRRFSSQAHHPGKQYSLANGTSRCTIARGVDNPRTLINNSKSRTDFSGNIGSPITSENDSSQCSSKQSTDLELSEISSNEHGTMNSRVQDELKENRDPVEPSSTIFTNDTANPIDRRNKCRLRSVGSNTMQQLNEQDGQTLEANRSNPRKDNEPHVTSPSRMSYSHWRENSRGVRALFLSSDEDANSISHGRQQKKSRTRSSCVNEDDENSDRESAPKRPKYANFSDRYKYQHERLLSNDSRNENSPMASLGYGVNRATSTAFKNEKTNSATGDRWRTSQDTKLPRSKSLCCKVSIDLIRIRAIIKKKLQSTTTEHCRFNGSTSTVLDEQSPDRNRRHVRSLRYGLLRKSHSVGNLTINDFTSTQQISFAKRKWRSAERLDDLSCQLRRNDGLRFNELSSSENMRGYRRNARFFEKHDCVR